MSTAKVKCPNCDGKEVELDNQMGHVVCVGCGTVLELNTMVSELTFTESSKGAAIADGFTLKLGQARAKSKGGFGAGGNSSLRTQQESSEATRERGLKRSTKPDLTLFQSYLGHNSIERAGNMQGINMGPNLIEKAKRVFDVALTARYTKGRRTNCVVAACCYITCRMEKTSHMMIDFADAFSTNVYQIGSIFLQLRVMFLEKSGLGMGMMPLVDPGLYMARFADKLDFGNDTAKVVANANRIAQRMDRDWIVRGRRPAGVCAAALFIAARMNGYKRTIREIVLVVKICEGTLRKRLNEFEKTESGKLSKTTFETINLDESANPPSFSLSKKHKVDQYHPHEVENLSHDVKGAVDQEDLEDEDNEELVEEAEQFIKKDTEKFQKDTLIILEKEDTLSDLDEDPEVMASIAMSDDETEFKRELWMAENHDWLAKQEANASKITKKAEPRKRMKKDYADGGYRGASSAIEATRKMVELKPAISKKINYEVLNNLLYDT